MQNHQGVVSLTLLGGRYMLHLEELYGEENNRVLLRKMQKTCFLCFLFGEIENYGTR